ncbi:MAG: PAS domain S-box protein [Candidatus Moduliflexus flocculans]|nr:PAS domain S-box protein [Candidatus Moduliflexus flocculans]
MERRSLALRKEPDLVVLLRADGTVAYVSPAVTRVLGHDPKAWIGHNALAYVHADERDCIRRHLLALGRDASESHTDTFRIQHQDGTWRWIAAARTNLLLDPSVEAVVCNARDVSEEKRALDLLRLAGARQCQDLRVAQVPGVDRRTDSRHQRTHPAMCARISTDSDHGFLSYIDPQLGETISCFPSRR